MAQRKRITTPKGTALYPHLRTPETYDGEVVGYTVQLQLSAAETKKMEKFLEGELDAAKNSSEFKGKKWTNARLGTKVDKNGDTVLKFKTTCSFKGRDGSTINRVVPVFDAHGKPYNGDIGHGSIIKVNFSVGPYWKSANNCGLSLYLNAVQVIELKERGQEDSKSFGFGEEEGFSAEDNTVPDMQGEVPCDDTGATEDEEF